MNGDAFSVVPPSVWETAAGGLPRASVVIPCWNAGPWVGRAIQSVLDQCYPELDVIVVDDGSTDRSLEIIKAFGDRVRWVSGPNRGACAARNVGLEMVDADWVLFFDADDYMEADLLQRLAMEARATDVDLAIGVSKTLGPDGSLALKQFPPGSSSDEILLGWLDFNYVQTGALLWRTSFVRQIGGWNPAVVRRQEIELVLRALLMGARARSFKAGYSVWDDRDEDVRISKRVGRPSITSDINFHDSLVKLVDPTRADIRLLLGRRFYLLALESYSFGYPDLVGAAMRRCRSLGFRGHTGPLRRRVVASVIGLENCARLRPALLRLGLVAVR